MKSAHASIRVAAGLRLRPLALALLSLGLAPALAQVAPNTLPTGFASIAGGLSVSSAPGALNVLQTTPRAIAQWQSFSIGSSSAVNVAQPSISSVLLSRVVGPDPSTIAGSLTSTGHVYLINPNGVLFAKGSSVSVGGLVASTLDVANDKFMAGGQLVFERDAGNTATVVNAGAITAKQGGTVALMGETVRNDGTINAPQGSIGLVSARKVIVDFNGDGLTTFTIPADSAATSALVTNTGGLTADGGLISMEAASTAVAQVVNQGGIVRARSISGHQGQIVLGASGANSEMVLGGSLDATGDPGTPGGSISAQAGLLRLDGASIDASGGTGGTVALAGTHGVAMSPTTVVRSDGSAGGGGNVMLSAPDGLLHVSGQLSAQGSGSGAGGQILTQGNTVEVGADTNVGAAGGSNGANGKWTIASSLDVGVVNADVPYQADSYAGNERSVINAGALGRALGRATDVAIGSDAGVAFDANTSVLKTAGRDATLTVNAANNIAMSPGSAIQASAGALNVDFNANAKGVPIASGSAADGAISMQSATIETNGGNIRFYGQSDPVNGQAIGNVGPNGTQRDGIALTGSVLSACAVGQVSCALPGDISLRGQGGGAGVSVVDSAIATGGNVRIDGAGADLNAMVGNANFASGTTTVAASNGVVLSDSNVTAGLGRQMSVSGTAGSNAFSVARDDSGGIVVTKDTAPAYGVSLSASAGHGLLKAEGGEIAIDGGPTDVMLAFTGSADTPTTDSMLSVASASRAGGNIEVTGRNIGVVASGSRAAQLIDASGAGNGGNITMHATADPAVTDSGNIAVGGNVGMRADANSASGNGGNIRLVADKSLRVGGLLSVRGGDSGGNGGFVETSASALDLSGLLVDASARAGTAGNWLIDPSNVDIIHRPFGGVPLASNPFDPGAFDSTITDGQINTVLHGGTKVTITTGTVGNSAGDVSFGTGVNITPDIDPTAPAAGRVAFEIDAAGSVLASPSSDTVIQSSLVPLDVIINAGVGGGPGIINWPGSISTNGGNLTMTTHASVNSGGGDIDRSGFTSTALTANPAAGGGTLTVNAGGASGDGNITWSGAIQTGGGAVNMTAGGIDGSGQGFINYQAGDMTTSGGSVTMTAGGASGGSGHGTVNLFGQILTNGGNVTMSARSTDADEANCAVCISNNIDTRVGQSNSGAGGTVTITGNATGQFIADGVDIVAQISSSTGDVIVTGTAQVGNGVNVFLSEAAPTAGINTTGGRISLTGLGTPTGNSAFSPGDGVTLNGATLQTTDGNIAVHGLSQAGAPSGFGVDMRDGALITTLGAGDIDVSGESAGNGAGVYVSPFIPGSPPNGTVFFPAQPASSINGNRNVVLRASNDGTTDAIVIGGTVRAGNLLDLRPGGVDATSGAAVDRTANPILLGGTASTGFAISADEITRLTDAGLVIGSNTHAANIELVAALTSAVPLTLENGGGGNITLDAPLSAPQLGLISGGNITQAPGASITAGELLARSSGGNVTLAEPTNNVSVNTLGGGAAGSFEFVNAGALTIGPVSVSGYDAASNLPQVVSATSLSANTVLVRTLSGDLGLAGNVNSTTSTDLVAAGRFQNLGGGTITGGPWRVWANTWVGETRGGLAGSGPLPSLYDCAYLGLCGVVVSPGDNHFIYAQQPGATVVIGNSSRTVGTPNPVFTFSITGLILGDPGTSFTGTTDTTATTASPAGSYPIFGTFTSAAGYAVTVVPGVLQISEVPPVPPAPPAPPLPVAPLVPLVVALAQNQIPDVVRDMPTTWLYDRNIGKVPICRPTEAVEDNRTVQGADVLGREWARVRSRPNLMSCVDTERRNGCADF